MDSAMDIDCLDLDGFDDAERTFVAAARRSAVLREVQAPACPARHLPHSAAAKRPDPYFQHPQAAPHVAPVTQPTSFPSPQPVPPKRLIPGPAGVLQLARLRGKAVASLGELEALALSPHPATAAAPASTPGLTRPPPDAAFESASWAEGLRIAGIDAEDFFVASLTVDSRPQRRTPPDPISRVRNPAFPNANRARLMVLYVAGVFQCAAGDLRMTVKDPTGTMTAAATAEVARRHKQGLAPGATIVLRDAAAIGLANAGRQYLCVSLGNVVAVVPPRGHAGRADLRECMGRFGSPSSPRNKSFLHPDSPMAGSELEGTPVRDWAMQGATQHQNEMGGHDMATHGMWNRGMAAHETASHGHDMATHGMARDPPSTATAWDHGQPHPNPWGNNPPMSDRGCQNDDAGFPEFLDATYGPGAAHEPAAGGWRGIVGGGRCDGLGVTDTVVGADGGMGVGQVTRAGVSMGYTHHDILGDLVGSAAVRGGHGVGSGSGSVLRMDHPGLAHEDDSDDNDGDEDDGSGCESEGGLGAEVGDGGGGGGGVERGDGAGCSDGGGGGGGGGGSRQSERAVPVAGQVGGGGSNNPRQFASQASGSSGYLYEDSSQGLD